MNLLQWIKRASVAVPMNGNRQIGPRGPKNVFVMMFMVFGKFQLLPRRPGKFQVTVSLVINRSSVRSVP